MRFAFDPQAGFCERPNAQESENCRMEERMDLLITIGIILLVLWLLGLVTSYTLGGFIHILLVLAIIIVLIRVIQGRKPIP